MVMQTYLLCYSPCSNTYPIRIEYCGSWPSQRWPPINQEYCNNPKPYHNYILPSAKQCDLSNTRWPLSLWVPPHRREGASSEEGDYAEGVPELLMRHDEIEEGGWHGFSMVAFHMAPYVVHLDMAIGLHLGHNRYVLRQGDKTFVSGQFL